MGAAILSQAIDHDGPTLIDVICQPLEEANAPTEGLAYHPTGTTYRLEASSAGHQVIHEAQNGPNELVEKIAELGLEPGA